MTVRSPAAFMESKHSQPEIQPQFTIHNKSCESMPELADESIHLTVTSPPYWNAIDYDIHANDADADHRQREYKSAGIEYNDYIQRMGAIFNEVKRATVPGGFLIVNVSTVLYEKKLYPLPFDLVAETQKHDWEFFADIIWNKVTSRGHRAGVYIQHRKLGYFYPNFIHEYIIVFRKPGPTRRGLHIEEGIPIDDLYTKDICNTVWHIAPVSFNQIKHPCPFPVELARRSVLLWSQEGDTVLDPFCGAGSTGVASIDNDRNFIGYETEAEYAKLAEDRIMNPEAPRPFNLIARYDKKPIGQ